jgi:hypothetical protein
MDEIRDQGPEVRGQELREIVKSVVEEFVGVKSLEAKVNELVAENQRARAKAEEAERSSAIRAELQRMGVAKIDLAYRAVKDDIYRSEDGRLMAQGGAEMRDYLAQFVGENPELLPARVSGGSGASAGQRSGAESRGVEIDKIRPGMSAEELDRARQEVARVAQQTLRGYS